jgi:hypothetical protein
VFHRVIVEENFERRKTLFANRLGDIAPALVTLPTAQFVSHGRSNLSGRERALLIE